jgi:hypothetical protein
MKAARSRTKAKDATTVRGKSILQGARDALAFAQGARDGYVVHVRATTDVKVFREKAQDVAG